MQKTQNRLLKILLNLNNLTNTNQLHKGNKILKINDLATLRNLLVWQKVVHHNSETNNVHRQLHLLDNRPNARIATNFRNYC